MARNTELPVLVQRAFDEGFRQGRVQSFKDTLRAFREITKGGKNKRAKTNHVANEKSGPRDGSNMRTPSNSGSVSGGRKSHSNRKHAGTGEHSVKL